VVLTGYRAQISIPFFPVFLVSISTMGKQGKRTGRTPASSGKDKSPSSSPSSPSSSSLLSSPKVKEKPKPDTSTEPNNPPFYLDLLVPSNEQLTCRIDMYEAKANTFHVSNNNDLHSFVQNAIHHTMLSTLEKAYGKLENETVYTLWDATQQCYSPTAVNSQVFRFTTTLKPKTREPFFRVLESFKDDPDAKPIIHCDIPQTYLDYYYKCGMSILADPNIPEKDYDNYLHLFPPHLRESYGVYQFLIERGQPPRDKFRDTIAAASDGNYRSYISLASIVSSAPPASATKQTSNETGNVNADNGPVDSAPPVEVTRDSPTTEPTDAQVRTTPTREATETAASGSPRHSDSDSNSTFNIPDYGSGHSGHSRGSPHSTQSVPMSPDSAAAELLRTDNIPGARRNSSGSNVPSPIPEDSPADPNVSTLTDEHIQHARGHRTVLNRTESIDFGSVSRIDATGNTSSSNIPPPLSLQQSTTTRDNTTASPRTTMTTHASHTTAMQTASPSTATTTVHVAGATSTSAATDSRTNVRRPSATAATATAASPAITSDAAMTSATPAPASKTPVARAIHIKTPISGTRVAAGYTTRRRHAPSTGHGRPPSDDGHPTPDGDKDSDGDGDGDSFPPPPGPPPPSGPSDPPPTEDPDSGFVGELNNGLDWRFYRADPAMLDDFIDDDHCCPPWRKTRPEIYSHINHSVRLDIHLMPKQAFNDALENRLLNTKHYPVKDFVSGFPSIPSDATNSQLFEFYSAVSRYCFMSAVYIPPLHTVEYEHNRGSWFDGIPAQCHLYFSYYDQLLLQVLCGKSTNLAGSERLKHLLHERSGYNLLWNLLRAAGHPRLSLDFQSIPTPRQGSKDSLRKYVSDWTYFLYMKFITGEFYSDRYFLETFIKNMHRIFNNNLKTTAITFLRRLPINRRVPHQWTLPNLAEYLVTGVAIFNDLALTVETTPRELADASRRPKSDSERRPTPVHQVETSPEPEPAPEPIDIRQTDLLDQDAYLSICALMASRPRTCDFCGSSSHLIAQCERLRERASNRTSLKRILDSLVRYLPTGGGYSIRTPSSTPASNASSSRSAPRATTPPASNRSRSVRALLQEDDTDTDISIHQLTDDDTDGSASDF
jgi:hypothetical protein